MLAKQTSGYSGSDLSTLVNDALMRPIKEIQQASKFKLVDKQVLLVQGLICEGDLVDSDTEVNEDERGMAWMPVTTDEPVTADVREIELAQIS